MRALALAAIVALSAPAWAAEAPPPDEAAPSIRILPGDDIGTTPFAMWRDGLVLRAPAGASLTVEDAFRLTNAGDENGTISLEMRDAPPKGWSYQFTLHATGDEPIQWDADATPRAELATRPREAIRVELHVEIAADAEPEGTLRLDASIVPHARVTRGGPG